MDARFCSIALADTDKYRVSYMRKAYLKRISCRITLHAYKCINGCATHSRMAMQAVTSNEIYNIYDQSVHIFLSIGLRKKVSE